MLNERKSTNSITHLVKIVAGEVFNERMRNMSMKHNFDLQASADKIVAQLLGNIVSSLESANSAWLENEDDLLIKELDVAIAQIAKNHRRSKGAILARISHKGLIQY